MKIVTINIDGVLSNEKIIDQPKVSSECWSVQFHGIKYCITCDLKDIDECGGKNIRKTLRNELGHTVPL